MKHHIHKGDTYSDAPHKHAMIKCTSNSVLVLKMIISSFKCFYFYPLINETISLAYFPFGIDANIPIHQLLIHELRLTEILNLI